MLVTIINNVTRRLTFSLQPLALILVYLTKEIELEMTFAMTTQLPLLVPVITSWRACQIFSVQTVDGAMGCQFAKVGGVHL